MSNIYTTNYNFNNCRVRFVINNSDCQNTSTIKYNNTMPNSDKYNRRKSDIRQIKQNFKRDIKNYTRNLVGSILGRMRVDPEDEDEDDMDY